MNSDPTIRLEKRLDNIDAKLDKLTEAFIGIKLLEQQMVQQNDSLTRAFKRIDAHDEEIDRIKQRQVSTGAKLDISERFVWIIVSAAVGLVAFFMRGG